MKFLVLENSNVEEFSKMHQVFNISLAENMIISLSNLLCQTRNIVVFF